MSISDNKKYFELVPEMKDQGILKIIFLTSSYQIPKNFPKKIKNYCRISFLNREF